MTDKPTEADKAAERYIRQGRGLPVPEGIQQTVDDATKQAYVAGHQSLKAENERLREALKSVRNEIALQAPQIIWHSEIETTFDYITGVLGDKMTWDEWAALNQEEG